MADYDAYLVRIWHPNDQQRLRIIVQDAHSTRQVVFTDFAHLNHFISRRSTAAQGGTSEQTYTTEIFS